MLSRKRDLIFQYPDMAHLLSQFSIQYWQIQRERISLDRVQQSHALEPMQTRVILSAPEKLKPLDRSWKDADRDALEEGWCALAKIWSDHCL